MYSPSELLSLGLTRGLALEPETVSRCRDLGLLKKKTSRGVRGGVNKRLPTTAVSDSTHVPPALQSDIPDLSCQHAEKKKRHLLLLDFKMLSHL